MKVDRADPLAFFLSVLRNRTCRLKKHGQQQKRRCPIAPHDLPTSKPAKTPRHTKTGVGTAEAAAGQSDRSSCCWNRRSARKPASVPLRTDLAIYATRESRRIILKLLSCCASAYRPWSASLRRSSTPSRLVFLEQ